MGSWSYVSPEKGLVLDESISAHHVIGRGENGLMMCSYASSLVVTNEEAIENQGVEELGFSKTRKNLVVDVLSTKVGGEKICSPITSTTNAFSGKEESSSMFSSSVVESNGQDPLLIDLKLGRIADHRDAQDFRTSKVAPMFSSAESSTPAKKARAALSSQTPFCQVYGCKKDLSPSKDYYKRHKVCEVHSKTPKVIVNGIEQRFCQQCSRFHLLAQFDDGKRSCRKRLADHNVRRRKPRVGIHSDRTGRLFQSYNGSRFQGSKLIASSVACPDIQLPSNLLCPQKYGMGDWSGHIRLERGADCCTQSATPVTYEYLHPKSPFPNGNEKQNHPFHVKIIESATGRDFNENSNECRCDLGALNSVSDSLIQNTSMGSEDLILYDPSSSDLGVSGMLTSGCALSLLSSQSQSSSSHSPGIPIAQPLTVCGSHTCYHVSQLSGKLLEQASISRMSNKRTSTGMSSVEEDHFDPILISDEGYTVDFTGGILQGSQFINAKVHLSPREDEPIIDLLQLSSQLQRVESQRQSMQAEQEKDAFSDLKVT